MNPPDHSVTLASLLVELRRVTGQGEDAISFRRLSRRRVHLSTAGRIPTGEYATDDAATLVATYLAGMLEGSRIRRTLAEDKK